MKIRILMTVLAMVAVCGVNAATPDRFVDFGAADRFIETSVHAAAGGSTVIQNYRSTFPEIENLNSNMGCLLGAGARVTFGIRGFLGLSTEFNMLVRNYNLDLSVVGASSSSMSAVFINSRAYYFNIPVMMTFRFNVARSVRWNVDLGAYYSYGFAGHQKQRIYVGQINGLGQFTGERIDVKSDYFNSQETFQNSFRRGDIGVHFGTSLNLGPHLVVGARIQAGIKNISFTQGIKNPSVRNLDLSGLIGWRF